MLFPASIEKNEARVNWLASLRLHVRMLNLALRKAYKPTPSVGSPCSVVVPTRLDIEGDVDRDGSFKFFKRTRFLDLRTGQFVSGLPGAGTKSIEDGLLFDCLRASQKLRNKFLRSSSDALSAHASKAPLPKDLIRHSAMAFSIGYSRGDGSEFDVMFGLDALFNFLFTNRAQSETLFDLYKLISVRRGAKGESSPVQAVQLVHLMEIVLDVAIENMDRHVSNAALPKLPAPSNAVFVAERFNKAFPGVRAPRWFDEPRTISERLRRFLGDPLIFEDERPFWWWRYGNDSIAHFEEIGGGRFLLGDKEMMIRRIAAVNEGEYDCLFVYVEVEALPPTGVTRGVAKKIRDAKKCGLIYSEEYGMFDKKTPIPREALEDGAAEIGGSVMDIRGRAELRIRYVTPYNFVIAACDSRFSHQEMDPILEEMMDEMLVGNDRLKDLSAAVQNLPKNVRPVSR